MSQPDRHVPHMTVSTRKGLNASQRHKATGSLPVGVTPLEGQSRSLPVQQLVSRTTVLGIP